MHILSVLIKAVIYRSQGRHGEYPGGHDEEEDQSILDVISVRASKLCSHDRNFRSDPLSHFSGHFIFSLRMIQGSHKLPSIQTIQTIFSSGSDRFRGLSGLSSLLSYSGSSICRRKQQHNVPTQLNPSTNIILINMRIQWSDFHSSSDRHPCSAK